MMKRLWSFRAVLRLFCRWRSEEHVEVWKTLWWRPFSSETFLLKVSIRQSSKRRFVMFIWFVIRISYSSQGPSQTRSVCFSLKEERLHFGEAHQEQLTKVAFQDRISRLSLFFQIIFGLTNCEAVLSRFKLNEQDQGTSNVEVQREQPSSFGCLEMTTRWFEDIWMITEILLDQDKFISQ